MKKQIVITATAILALGTLGAQANLVVNGDFENPDITGATSTAAIPNWIKVGGLNRLDDTDTVTAAPLDVLGTTNQVLRMGNTASTIRQDVVHNWATTDSFVVGFNASEANWRAQAGRDDILVVRIVETVSGDILWSSTIDMNGTYDTTVGDVWSAAQTFVYNVDASAFTTGTAGSAISLEFFNDAVTAASSTIWLDNASMVIPEPATLGMVALFGGGILMIRRKLML